MKPDANDKPVANKRPLTTELLLLPDGRVLVHNLTPVFAELLAEFNPDDDQLAPRVTRLRGRSRSGAAKARHLSPFRQLCDRSAAFTPLQYPDGKHLRTRKRRERRAPVASQFIVPMRGQHLENCP